MTFSISNCASHIGEGAGWLLSGLNAHYKEVKLEQFAVILKEECVNECMHCRKLYILFEGKIAHL